MPMSQPSTKTTFASKDKAKKGSKTMKASDKSSSSKNMKNKSRGKSSAKTGGHSS